MFFKVMNRSFVFSYLTLCLMACGHYKSPQPTQQATVQARKQHFANMDKGWVIFGKTSIEKQSLDANNSLIAEKPLALKGRYETLIPFGNSFVVSTEDSIFTTAVANDSVKFSGRMAKSSACDMLAVANKHLYFYTPSTCVGNVSSPQTLKIVSLADLKVLKTAAVINMPNDIMELESDGSLLFVRDASSINIYSTVNPLNPMVIGTISTNTAHKISIRNKTLWVTEATALRLFDYSDPKNPTLTRTIKF